MILEDLDTDIKILEDIFEEAHCEVMHDKPLIARWCAPCTHQVVAILTHKCTGRSGKVCQAVVDSAADLGDLNLVCRGCNKTVEECWIFTPA